MIIKSKIALILACIFVCLIHYSLISYFILDDKPTIRNSDTSDTLITTTSTPTLSSTKSYAVTPSSKSSSSPSSPPTVTPSVSTTESQSTTPTITTSASITESQSTTPTITTSVSITESQSDSPTIAPTVSPSTQDTITPTQSTSKSIDIAPSPSSSMIPPFIPTLLLHQLINQSNSSPDPIISHLDSLSSQIHQLSSNNSLNFSSLARAVSEFNFNSLSHSPSLDLSDDHFPILIKVSNRSDSAFFTLLSQLASSYDINSTFLLLSHDHYDFAKIQKTSAILSNLPNLRHVQVIFPYGVIQYLADNPFGLKTPPDSGRLHLKWVFHELFNQFSSLQLHDPKFKLNENYFFPNISQFFFLEDDYWVLPDFYSFAYNLSSPFSQLCPNCLSINMGARGIEHLRPLSRLVAEWQYTSTAWEVECVQADTGAGLGAGLVIRREIWNKLEDIADEFCHVNTVPNWDTIISLLMQTRRLNVSEVQVKPTKARVHHAGKCVGMHKKERRCGKNQEKEWALERQEGEWMRVLWHQFKEKTQKGMVSEEERRRMQSTWRCPTKREYHKPPQEPRLYWEWGKRYGYMCEKLPFIDSLDFTQRSPKKPTR
eukprot:TRINITY_DN3421_c0_g1_i2.p1 TRINITY_DN3421_c0_g1~~TRINITY_DN3421_c0_g1_i2.p1  ORF type:complete len:600 (-),score=92.18 TRINITY_DN3421_c0_g1_i2:12-1811(-)